METSEFFNTIILLGALQGFIVSVLLLLSKKKSQQNRLLAALIFLMALASFNLYGYYKNWFESDLLRFIVNFIPLVVVMAFGPLIWLYVQSALDPSFKLSKQHRKYFYPVIIDLIPAFTVIIFMIGLLTGLFKNNPVPWANFIDSYNVYADIPRWCSVTYYVWCSYKYFLTCKSAARGSLNRQIDNYKWLQQFINVFLGFQVLWFAYLIPYIIPRYSDKILDTLGWYPIYIPLAVMIYWLGIKGYMAQQQETSSKPVPASSALTAEVIVQTILALTKAMEEDALFLNTELNLSILAQHIGITQKTISAVLNQHLQKSFNEFINNYRVEAFKEKIVQPEMEHLTIAGIAAECGFNSQATFQRTFKQVTGKSPSEFRNKANLYIRG
ncbi:AraC family transcriptional regulator [soil metagenome]